MKHQAAYSLLFLSGKSAPTKTEVEKYMKDCGVSSDKAELDQFFTLMGDKSVTDCVKAGSKMTVSMPSGGGAPSAAVGGKVAEKVVEEEKKEEVEDVDMGGLFGDEDDY